MYSVVLMAALTSGGETPDFFRCRGCRGCHSSCACAGCHGCYGAGWAYGYGCYGCSGWRCAGWAGHGWGYGGYGCLGCYGCHGSMGVYACYGGWTCYGCQGGLVSYVPYYRPAPRQAPLPQVHYEDDTQAHLSVQVPSDAKLFVDGMETRTSSENRVFDTPPLQRGSSYYYDVRVEIIRAGRTISETRQVVVRAGETASVSFANVGSPNRETQTAQGR